MYKYRIYGMVIESELELLEAIPAKDSDQVDATIKEAIPPQQVVEDYRKGMFSGLKDNEMWFRIYDEILIYVKDGKDVLVWKINPDISREKYITYILTGALTFLMFQRGIIPVHGSGISYKGETFIISGGSGSGKSTTALELLKKPDMKFVTDDICGLEHENGVNYINPGPIWQRLCKDVYEKEYDEERYQYLGELDGKYARKLLKDYVSDKEKVTALFEIVREDREDVAIKEITGAEKVVYLTHNLFRGELYYKLGLNRKRMLDFVRIAANMRIYEVLRPNGRDTKEQVTEIIYKKLLQSC